MNIIIPAYNCSNTINRTLDSLVTQINSNFSVTIVDDCSTEDIYTLICKYQDKLDIKYIRNEVNVGCGMSRQKGIDETDSNYIAFLDSDDILLPNAVQIWLMEIEKSKPDVIYTPFFSINKNIINIKRDSLFMCHGKVYNTDFMRKYDIRESVDVKCNDDSYLNWQAFDLATNVSLLNEPTYLWINTPNSVTHKDFFTIRAIDEFQYAKNLAKNQIMRFKENPLSNYNTINTQVYKILNQNNEKYKTIANDIRITKIKEVNQNVYSSRSN